MLPQSLRPLKGRWDRLPCHTGKQVAGPQQQCRFQAASRLSGVPGSFPSQERPGKAQAAYLNGRDVQPGSAHQPWDHIKIAHRAPAGQVRESWPGNSRSRPELRPLPSRHAAVPTAPAPEHAAPSAGVLESSIRKGPPGTQQARTLEFEENLNQTEAIKENKEQEGYWAVKSSPRPTPRPPQTPLSSPVSPVRRERVSRHYRVPVSPAIVPPPLPRVDCLPETPLLLPVLQV